jgi:hypothetical protein
VEGAEGADDADTAIVAIMAQVRDCSPEEQHATRVAWARSPWAHPLMMLMEGWQGEVARASYAALKRDLGRDTPGRRWDACEPANGRASILRLLDIADEPVAAYAAAPFRTWVDDDDRSWIAGAVGIMPFLDPDAAIRWRHIDIREVILWDPRTNEARIAGEPLSRSDYVLPDYTDGTLKVWGDPAAFFRAWAAERVRIASLIRAEAQGQWAHPIVEPADGGLPGALLVGDVADARWPRVDATTIVAEEGASLTDMRWAAVRAAGLPQFAEALA